jgi:hypothetical protein
MPASTRRRSTEEYKREAVIGISLSFSGPVGNTLPGNRELERLEKAVPEPKKGRTLSLRAGNYGLDLSDDPPMKWRDFSPVRFCGSTM